MFSAIKLAVEKCSTFCNSFRNSEASEQEMQEYFAKCELEQQESERNYKEYLAQRKAEDEELERKYLELELECKKRLEDLEFNRAEDERERRERETEAEQAEEEHYRSHCPTCGSRLRLGGRCPGCDEAFGH